MSTSTVVKLSSISGYSNIKKNLDNKKSILQFLPSTLLSISNSKTIEFKGIKLKSSYLIDIVHNMILKYYFKKDNKYSLMATILKEKYGYLYNHYIDYLIEKKIILLLSNHQKGKRCRAYALNESVIRSNITRYENDDNVLIKKYKVKVIQLQEDLKHTLIDSDIKQKLISDLFTVDIEYYRSIFYLDNVKEDIDVYNRNKYSVECINDKHIFYHFDNYGRFHTNFTILKSFIRKNCLLINGEETYEMDIINSQPLFLSKLICDFESKWVNPDELYLFRSLTIAGNYYKYIMDNTGMDKKSVKELTYKVLFGRNGYNSKSDKIFSALFPTIHYFIKLYKSENNNYKILAHELQKSESNLIFNKIIRKILQDMPEINILTVHDSIIVPISYKDRALSIFRNEIDKEFGIIN